ncbi:unnamed protein product [Miscanthus lutarioriparius]|uniref:Ferulate 5-hydroxylase n=1 Tax=Miscanthus lutarioriparius TaxID=422564 RepID=A0A811QC19_9POAL|nr:unnamed protein product [Miscanthus lutarioriparius]
MAGMATIAMEWPNDLLSWVFLASLAVVLLQLRQQSKLPLPPGPQPLPIIGNMMMMGQLTHRGMAVLAERYGGLLHLRLGRRHVFVVSTAEYAREVLQAQDVAFANRPATTAIAYLSYGNADMAFAHYGPFWRQARKLSVTKLFSRRRAETWLAVRDDCSGEAVNLGDLVFSLSTNVIYRAAFGTRGCEGLGEYTGFLKEFSQNISAFNIGDFMPWIAWIDPNRRLRETRDGLDKFIDKIIDDHIQRGRSSTDAQADIVDEMLACIPGDAVDDRHGSLRLTRGNIKAIILDLMFGGTETVASSIEWAMKELLRNPDDLRRLQQELADVVGMDRNVTESDLSELPFLTCVVKETLRMHPPIPMLYHATAKDCVVGGYSVPRGSQVTVNVWAIGRDRRTWKDPDVFRPSRFAAQDGNASGLDLNGSCFEFLPFGSGRRSCPGMALGLHALELAVAQLAHGFHWALPSGMKPSDIDVADVFGLSAPSATRLYAVPTPRLTCPLY